MPTFTARMQYLQAIYDRYHKAGKQGKSLILDEFCKVCRYHRKHALRLLQRPKPSAAQPRITRRRPCRYSSAVLQIARELWKASGYLCGQRLKEAIPLWLPAARQRFQLSADLEKQLLAISARQLDRRLQSHKRQLRSRFYSTTRPGRLLKSMIPIRTFNSDITRPGYLEIDTVAHCGRSLQGDFLYTLTATDIFTGWTDRVALLGKGQYAVVEALQTLQARLPFRLRGIDSDNGEEFINYHFLAYCRSHRLLFTRSRPNKKNDNPHVEQKNFTHVRSFLGWQRFESLQARDRLNELYAKELLYFQNLFQPSLKLKTKTHIGSKILRRYDRPQTPFDRLQACPGPRRPGLRFYQTLRLTLNPFVLSQTLDQKLEALHRLSVSRPSQPPSPYPSPSPNAAMDRFFFKAKRLQQNMVQVLNTSKTSQERRLATVTS
jgi:hypothetical protein